MRWVEIIRHSDSVPDVSDHDRLEIVRFESDLVDIVTGRGEMYVDYMPHG